MDANGRQLMQGRASVVGRTTFLYKVEGMSAPAVPQLHSRSLAFIRGCVFLGEDLGCGSAAPRFERVP
jgi:hypothetical protein